MRHRARRSLGLVEYLPLMVCLVALSACGNVERQWVQS